MCVFLPCEDTSIYWKPILRARMIITYGCEVRATFATWHHATQDAATCYEPRTTHVDRATPTLRALLRCCVISQGILGAGT